MQKQAPSFGRILTMVLFALSCFGLLLFLWISFGGAIPLKPKGYQFKIAFPEATQLGTLIALLNPPSTGAICPGSTQAPGGG